MALSSLVHPTFTFGPVVISGFVAMVVVGAVLGVALALRQAIRAHVQWQLAFDIAVWTAIAGFIGSKLYSLIQSPEQLADYSLARFRGTGQVWYGALIAGAPVALWRTRRARLPFSVVMDQGAPIVAAGNAVVRIGCFLAGDDYGFSTSLPWGIAFPTGAPPSTAGYLREHGEKLLASIPDTQIVAVHPTMIYEAIGAALIALVLWRRSHRAYRPLSNVGLYCVWYGMLRFAIEFIRPKVDMLSMGLTVAQLISAALFVLGLSLLAYSRGTKPAMVREQLTAG